MHGRCSEVRSTPSRRVRHFWHAASSAISGIISNQWHLTHWTLSTVHGARGKALSLVLCRLTSSCDSPSRRYGPSNHATQDWSSHACPPQTVQLQHRFCLQPGSASGWVREQRLGRSNRGPVILGRGAHTIAGGKGRARGGSRVGRWPRWGEQVMARFTSLVFLPDVPSPRTSLVCAHTRACMHTMVRPPKLSRAPLSSSTSTTRQQDCADHITFNATWSIA